MRAVLAVAALLVALIATEAVLRFAGFGYPVLYENRLGEGYVPVPGQQTRRFGGARVSINNLGVRGANVPRTPPPGAIRLLFLGDSVTYGGSAVDDDALFSSRAAEVVRRVRPGVPVDVLNAGVNGWGPENVRAFVRHTGGFDSTVWVFTVIGDDLAREQTHLGEVPYFARAPRFAWEEVLVLGAYQLLGRYKARKSDADLTALAERNLEVVRSILAMGRRRGAGVLLVWHPAAAAVAGGGESWLKTALAKNAARDEVAWLDLLPAYRAADADLFVDGLHLSVAGHTVAGAAIGTELVSLLSTTPAP